MSDVVVFIIKNYLPVYVVIAHLATQVFPALETP